MDSAFRKLYVGLRKAGWKYRRGQFIKHEDCDDPLGVIQAATAAIATVNDRAWAGADRRQLMVRGCSMRRTGRGVAVSWEIEAAPVYKVHDGDATEVVVVYRGSDFNELFPV